MNENTAKSIQDKILQFQTDLRNSSEIKELAEFEKIYNAPNYQRSGEEVIKHSQLEKAYRIKRGQLEKELVDSFSILELMDDTMISELDRVLFWDILMDMTTITTHKVWTKLSEKFVEMNEDELQNMVDLKILSKKPISDMTTTELAHFIKDFLESNGFDHSGLSYQIEAKGNVSARYAKERYVEPAHNIHSTEPAHVVKNREMFKIVSGMKESIAKRVKNYFEPLVKQNNIAQDSNSKVKKKKNKSMNM